MPKCVPDDSLGIHIDFLNLRSTASVHLKFFKLLKNNLNGLKNHLRFLNKSKIFVIDVFHSYVSRLNRIQQCTALHMSYKTEYVQYL